MIRTHADDVNGKQIDDKVNKEITFYELRDKFYPEAPTFSWNLLIIRQMRYIQTRIVFCKTFARFSK